MASFNISPAVAGPVRNGVVLDVAAVLLCLTGDVSVRSERRCRIVVPSSALGVCKVLWRAVWPTVWFSLGIKKGGSIEPPIVGGFLVLVGGGVGAVCSGH